MGSKINFVKFSEFLINMNNNNAVELEFTNNEGEIDKVDIGKYVQISFIDDGIDLKIKDSDKFIKSTLSTYSKSLLFLISNIDVKKALKEYYSIEENSQKDVFVIRTNGDNFLIGEKISKLNVRMDILNELNKQKNMTETEKKENLKVYETPSNMFDIMFSLIQQSSLKYNFAPDIVSEFKDKLKKDLEVKFLDLKENSKDKLELKKIKSLLDAVKSKNGLRHLTDVFDSITNETRRHYLETLNDELYTSLKNYIEAEYVDAVNDFKILHSVEFPFKHLKNFNVEIPDIPIMDFQAGSGDGILKSATKTDFPLVLQGTEFRNFENLDLDKDTLDFRYKVETGKNFNIYKDAYKKTFANQTLYRAISSTPIYLNPPYNADNQIAKESIEILKDKQLVFGLFPTSMKNFLSEHIDGFIFEVNKELTGYTDDRVPEKLLFIVGRKFEEELLKHEIANLTSYKKHTMLRNLESKDVTGAIKEIQRELKLNEKIFPFDNFIRNMFTYHAEDNNRVDSVFRVVKKNILDLDDFILNSEKLFTAIDEKSEYIRNEFGSESMLLKAKVFPNIQFFNEDSKVEYITFSEVISNHGLLVAYRDNYPEILNLIQKIAKKENIELNIMDSFTSLYDLDNPYKPILKDKILTQNIGLMKNYYLPSSFDLTKIENKEHILKILSKVYEDKADSALPLNMRDILKDVVYKTSRLITKLETTIRGEKDVLKDEIFVAIDEDGIDIGKFQISKTDFYKAMQDLGYFDLNDYVELAEINEQQKDIIIENLLKHVENSIFLIAKFNNIDKNVLEQDIMKSLVNNLMLNKMYGEQKISNLSFNEQYNKTFVEFISKYEIQNYFNNYINFDKKLESKFREELNNNISFISVKKADIEATIEKIFDLYKKSPLDFFEFKRDITEEWIENLMNDLMSKNNSNPLSEKQLSYLKIDIYNLLSQDFVKRKAVFEASTRLSKLMIMNYGYMKYKKLSNRQKGIEISNVALYDEVFERMSSTTFGLMPHQFKTSERFLGVCDDIKMDMKMWEMRAGKTLGFTFEAYLLSLYRKEDVHMLLESKNVDDITIQIMSHLPHLFMNSNFYLAKSNAKDAVISGEKTYTHLVNAEYYPNIPNTVKSYFIGRGEMTKSELDKFAYEFEKLIVEVEAKGFDKAYMLENYKDSKFLDVLNISCMKSI